MRKIYLLSLFVLPLCVFGQKKDITLENIWKTYDFYPKSVKGFKSMNNGDYYSKIDTKDSIAEINKYSFRTGKKVSKILDSRGIEFSINNYTFSEDEKKVLFATETEGIYRYSSKSKYFIYDLTTKKVDTLKSEKVMYASFSPKGDKVAYVFQNNLFIKNIKSKGITQITFDGELNKIINGASDWVYEEEFGLVKAFQWSPNGEQLVYYKFDEGNVKAFSMDMFKNELYPSQYEFKYPKAGEKNSKVSIYLYDLKTQKTNTVIFDKEYEYLPRLGWTKNENIFFVSAMNRHQNELDFILFNSSSLSSRVLFTETDKYYVDIHDNTTFTEDKKHMIWTSERSGFNHIYLINLESGNWKQITTGGWEVTKYHGMDKEKSRLFYTSNEDGTIHRGLYSIGIDGNDKIKLSSKIGTHNSTFSNGMKYYSNTYSTADTPPYISLHNNNGNEIRVLEDNSALLNTMNEFDLSNKEFFTFKTSEDIELNGWMIKPSDFDATKKYPVFMFLYGGPGSQQVLNSWGWFNYFWYQHLAQKGYIVVCVDNRGTGGRGSEFKKLTYQQLGKYETIDQIEANKYLGNLDYVDKQRIGIQGWSYGGYLSSLAITKGAEYFKMAIAVAPVTNWRYYDNIYTERYMRTPQENPEGYDENSPINHVEKLKGEYLLIHGSADDNVHVQNTYEMVSALVKANKQFDLFIYPDKNHGIYGGNTRLHLYKKMTNFIEDNL